MSKTDKKSIIKPISSQTPKAAIEDPEYPKIHKMVLQEIAADSKALDATLELFNNSGKPDLKQAATILEPVSERLRTAIQCEFQHAALEQ